MNGITGTRNQQRMYCIVMRHLSGIQKGIQAAHAIVEYANWNSQSEEYKQWAQTDKTLIVLEANRTEELRTVSTHLVRMKYPVEAFTEPDLDNAVTAIAFLLDDTIWNSEKYAFHEETECVGNDTICELKELISPFRLASN